MIKRNSVFRFYQVSLAMLMSLAGLSACSSDSSSTTTSPTTATLATDTFSGSIAQNESGIHRFTVTTSGYSLLAGFTAIAPSSVGALGLGIGSWDTSTSVCSLNLVQNDTSRSGNTSLSATPNSGNFCLRVYDGGNVPSGAIVSYTVQVQHY